MESPQQLSAPSIRSRKGDFDADLGLAPPFTSDQTQNQNQHDAQSLKSVNVGGELEQQQQQLEVEQQEVQDEAVHFCLLAEFDIDMGATLADQYPHPTGTDEQ